MRACVAVWELGVGMCLCSQHHMLFPAGCRLGLSVKGGAGAEGVREGEGRRVKWPTHPPG